MRQISLFVGVFGAMLAIANWLPDLFQDLREAYQRRSVKTARELSRAFINVKPAKIMMFFAGFGALFALLTQNWVLGIAIAFGGLIAPRIILNVYRDIRSAKFDTQLIDALMLLGNSLKSGLDMAAGIERVSTSMKPPLSEEFGVVLNSYRLGAPLETALLDMTTRIQSRSLETTVSAIILQRESGGNVIRTFDQLVVTMRDEMKLQRKVQAMTSQGRMQILVLAIMPWGLAILIYFMSPDFMAPALRNPWGQIGLVCLLIWEAIGIVVTRRLVTVEF